MRIDIIDEMIESIFDMHYGEEKNVILKFFDKGIEINTKSFHKQNHAIAAGNHWKNKKRTHDFKIENKN